MLSFGTVSSLFRGSGLEGEIRRAGAPSKCPRGSASPPVPRAAAGRAGPEPGRSRAGPRPPRVRPSRSATGAEPPRPRHRRRSCRGAMALLPRRFLCFVLGKCGRRDTTSLEPVGRRAGLPGIPLCAGCGAPAASPLVSPLSLKPGEAPARLRWRHSSRESKGAGTQSNTALGVRSSAVVMLWDAAWLCGGCPAC